MLNFTEIIGCDDVKNELEMIADTIANPGKYDDFNVHRPKSLLIYGDTGMGKTSWSKCFVESFDYPCISYEKNGEFREGIQSLFKKENDDSFGFLFIDDLDKCIDDKADFEILRRCMEEAQNKGVFVVATVTNIYDIPESLRTINGFDRIVEIVDLEKSDTEKIVKHYLSKRPYNPDINISDVAGFLHNKPIADIVKVINDAGMYAVYENRCQVEMKDITKAYLRLIYGALEKNNVFEDELEIVAYHEAGHAIIGEILEPGSVHLVSVQPNYGNASGYTVDTLPKGYWDSKKKMENRVRTILGGRAALEIVFNETDTGANSDLHRAFDLVERFVDDFCSYGFDKWMQINNASNELLNRREQKIKDEMDRLYDEAKSILKENMNTIEVVAHTLLDETTITGTRLRELIDSIDGMNNRNSTKKDKKIDTVAQKAARSVI